MNLLQINTSLFSDAGQSTKLADRFVAGRRALDPRLPVVVRDLAREPVPHLTAERFAAFLAKPDARNLQQQAIVAQSDALIDELKTADTIVIGLPMYNFGVPSTLKAYFDHVARAGATFRYTETGPVGLLTGKKAYVLATRGGAHAGTSRDVESAYVRQFLGFLGITDVEFVYAEGLAISEAGKQSSLASAVVAIERINSLARLAA
jgi:FMN-dependent NADH-azoreductase